MSYDIYNNIPPIITRSDGFSPDRMRNYNSQSDLLFTGEQKILYLKM